MVLVHVNLTPPSSPFSPLPVVGEWSGSALTENCLSASPRLSSCVQSVSQPLSLSLSRSPSPPLPLLLSRSLSLAWRIYWPECRSLLGEGGETPAGVDERTGVAVQTDDDDDGEDDASLPVPLRISSHSVKRLIPPLPPPPSPYNFFPVIEDFLGRFEASCLTVGAE